MLFALWHISKSCHLGELCVQLTSKGDAFPASFQASSFCAVWKGHSPTSPNIPGCVNDRSTGGQVLCHCDSFFCQAHECAKLHVAAGVALLLLGVSLSLTLSDMPCIRIHKLSQSMLRCRNLQIVCVILVWMALRALDRLDKIRRKQKKTGSLL